MAQSIYHLTRLYQEAIYDVSDTMPHWMMFLESAARNYRYPFQDQVLIHHQRPEATAVLKFEQWESMFHRRIHRGSTGIGVFDRRNGRTAVKYYFDIADTYATPESIPVPLWTLNPEDYPRVLELLQQGYRATSPVLSDAVKEAAANAASAIVEGYAETFQSAELMVDVAEFQTLAEHSITYMLLYRLDMDPFGVLTQMDDLTLSYLDNQDAINQLGGVVNVSTSSILTEIAKIVRTPIQEQTKFFAESEPVVYDKARKNEITEPDKGGNDHGDDLHIEERTESARPDVRPVSGNGAKLLGYSEHGNRSSGCGGTGLP